MNRPLFTFVATLHSFKTNIAGNGRIELDTGRESREIIEKLQMFSWEKNLPVAIALVPIFPDDPEPVFSISDVVPEEMKGEASGGDETGGRHDDEHHDSGV